MSSPTDPQTPLPSTGGAAAGAAGGLKKLVSATTSLVQPGESEIQRWRRTFERFAVEEVDGKK